MFGTGGSERCDVVDPAEDERAQLEALRRQAESFAAFGQWVMINEVTGGGNL